MSSLDCGHPDEITVRELPAPRSRIEKVWLPPGAEGKRPSFSLSTLAWSLAFTTSTPSTVTTSAPRSISSAEAGVFGSV